MISQKKLPLSHKKFLTYICSKLKIGWNANQIAKKLKIKKQKVYYWIKRLEACGFILRDYRTSQVFYHVYLNELKNYFWDLEVQKKEMGLSIHKNTIRFPYKVKPERRIKRVFITDRDGVTVDINNESIMVQVPRLMIDRFSKSKKKAIDNLAFCGAIAYQYALKYAMKLGAEIDVRDIEFVGCTHVAKDVWIDASMGVLEIEKLIRFKTRYERGDPDQEKIDRYIL